jgi:hypothetical protein
MAMNLSLPKKEMVKLLRASIAVLKKFRDPTF